MSFADHYFSKQKGFIPCPDGPPSGQLRFIVVIPACREPNLVTALDSLNKCDQPHGSCGGDRCSESVGECGP